MADIYIFSNLAATGNATISGNIATSTIAVTGGIDLSFAQANAQRANALADAGLVFSRSAVVATTTGTPTQTFNIAAVGPLVPGNVRIVIEQYYGALTLEDNGAGAFGFVYGLTNFNLGLALTASSVNYGTGAVTLTFTGAIASGDQIHAYANRSTEHQNVTNFSLTPPRTPSQLAVETKATVSSTTAFTRGAAGVLGLTDPEGNPLPASQRPYPGKDQIIAAKSQLTIANIAQCGTCPSIVMSTLISDVAESLDQIKRIKSLTQILNRVARSVRGAVVEAINAFVELIPHPPLLDIREFVALLTCPLTPQAILVEQFTKSMAAARAKAVAAGGFTATNSAFWTAFSTEFARESILLAKLDPRRYLRMLQDMINAAIEDIKRRWERFLDTLEATARAAIRSVARIVNELFAVIKDVAYIAVRLAFTRGNTALIKATCPLVYNNPQYPFKEYDETVKNFEFSGVLPTGIEDLSKPAADAMMRLFMRLAEWQTAAVILVV